LEKCCSNLYILSLKIIIIIIIIGAFEMVVRNTRLIQEEIKILKTLKVPRQCGSSFS